MNSIDTTCAIRRVNADTLTPIDILYGCDPVALLESAMCAGKTGRYSIAVIDVAFSVYKKNGRYYRNENKKENEISATCFFDALAKAPQYIHDDTYDIAFPLPTGGVGFIGYECVGEMEPAVRVHPSLPDDYEAYMIFGRTFIIFDHLHHECICVAVRYEDETIDCMSLCEKLISNVTELPHTSYNSTYLDSHLIAADAHERTNFINNVRYIKSEIEKGNLLQCVLSRTCQIETDLSPKDAYRLLRRHNPSPYMFFIVTDRSVVFGASPEEMVSIRDGRITMKPIAGTRPRGKSQSDDDHFEYDLLADEKECAEHRMLVDLTRNDIGRCAQSGSVNVPRTMYIERYSHVMHIVSDVEGLKKENYSVGDCVAAVFPAGTVSGAPKIQAINTITTCETSPRGVYAGLIGYIDQYGNFDSCIAIRTAIQRGNIVTLQAGAGIVYDSVPEREYEETEHKMRVFTKLYGIQNTEEDI